MAAAEEFRLAAPIACEVGSTCFIQNYVDQGPAPKARDYQCGSLTYNGHNGVDIRLPNMRALKAGVDVLAAASGRVLRARDGVAETEAPTMTPPVTAGLECGNGVILSHEAGWETQYCHLAQGSVRVREGDQVAAGQPIGRVGLSGRTTFPHLHLTVRQQGKVVDPFAVDAPAGSCGAGRFLWKESLREAFAYRPRVVLNTGFSSRGPVAMAMIESGEFERPPRPEEAAALIAYARSIGLRAGDVQQFSLTAPDGMVIAAHTAQPLERDQAQTMLFTGARRPPAGWPPGEYVARYSVVHDSKVVLEKSFAVSF